MPPAHQLGNLGECSKLPSGSGAEPHWPTDFSHFDVLRTALVLLFN